MNGMQFYRKRTFSELISDTFGFFKIYGKNYFKNYFLINGLLLILLVVLVVFGYREFFMQLFGSNLGGESYYFEEYFEDNIGILILLVAGFLLLGAAITMVSYTFPVFYTKRIVETNTQKITSDEILSDLKNNAWRLTKLFLGLLFIVTPAFLVVFSISYVLVIIVIGFFILLLLMPASMNIVNFLLYDYLVTKKSFFESLSFAVRAQFSYPHNNEPSPFWKYWGTSAIIWLINYVVTMIFTMAPMIILWSVLYTAPGNSAQIEQNPFQGTLGVTFFVLYALSILVSFILMNVLIVASGLMYYDNRSDLHQKVELLEIDSIGTHEQ